MRSDFVTMSDLQYTIVNLRRQLEAFKSGSKYIQMQKAYDDMLRREEGIIRKLKRELSEIRAQVVDVRNKWFQTCEDVLDEKERLRHEKDAQIERLKQRVLEVERQRDEALDKLKEKTAAFYEAGTQLEEEREKNRLLQSRLNKDYTNSSRPSSADPNHKTIHNSRDKTGRSPGGQPGHDFHGRKKLKVTQSVEVAAPAEYLDREKFKATGRIIHKQLIVARIAIEVIDYYTPEFRNLKTGQRVHAVFPNGLKDNVTYDASVKALAYLLNNDCTVSIDRTISFLQEASGGQLNLSKGMVSGLVKQFSEKSKEERNEIYLQLAGSDVLHVDFTFGRREGKTGTVLICATPGAVLYQAKDKKGHDGVKGSPVEVYEGTIVSDHEKTFRSYGTRWQDCVQHIERYARGVMENEPERGWGEKLLHLLEEMQHDRNSIGEGNELPEEKVREYEKRFDEIAQEAKRSYEDEPPGDYYKEGYNLSVRLNEDREAILLFLHDRSVPATNNTCERAARVYKRKNHQVMSFRSKSGDAYYCDGLSVIQTMKKQGKNLIEGVTKIFKKTAGVQKECGKA